ncbi:MAG: diphthine--ammonia ligase [Verrucomicrobia bacterium]|nr:MAG: diphthine--ammonia ligase [Verrucomicrobiota bacterium]
MPVVMSWSGGKDSAIALHELLQTNDYELVSLMTTVSEEYRRISHHGVRETLLEEQARAIGIPLEKVYLPSGESGGCTNEVYEEVMSRVMNSYKARGVDTVGFGDLFLEELRAWREANLSKVGMRGIFPIWKRDTTKVAHDLIRFGYKAYVSCVEGKVGSGFVGRLYDEEFLGALPPGVDPCGENGEFHSFVFDGPIFKRPVSVRVGEIVTRDGRYYADLLPKESEAVEKCTPELIPPV